MTYLVVRPSGAIGLSGTSCRCSFEIPPDLDRYLVLREARDTTSDLHRLLTLQVALMEEAMSQEVPLDQVSAGEKTLIETALAIGRRKIDAAMQRVGAGGYDAMSLAVLQTSLLPLLIEVTDWTLLRVRADGKRHILGYRALSRRHRFSSPIRSFDRATSTATTSSGNRYALVGDPSQDRFDDALVCWWLAMNNFARHDVAIITVDDL